MRLLSPREERIALAAFEAIFPSGASQRLDIGSADVDMRAYLLDVVAVYPPRLRRGLRALFWLLEATALVLHGKSFSSLSLDTRERLLLRLYTSRIYWLRYVALMLKTVAALGYFGFPEVRERLGYIKSRNFPPVGVVSGEAGPISGEAGPGEIATATEEAP